MVQDHDHSYRRLFSHPEMVRDLLIGYVREEWVAGLDFATLEKVNASYVTDDLRSRHDDVVWRVRWGEQWLYVYLLLEFQSTIDRHMAVRMLAYVALLYQDLLRQDPTLAHRSLPPVLPIVLYNGEARWTAPRDIEELIERVPGGLEAYRPSLRYLLLDEGELLGGDTPAPPEVENLAQALFRLEHSRDERDMLAVLGRLVAWLQAPEQASLRRAFVTWLKRVYLRRGHIPESDARVLDQTHELEEVQDMLAERVERWYERWKDEGKREGKLEGEAGLLLWQIEQKFGSAAAARHGERVRAADEATLKQWSAQILTARTADEVFAEGSN